MVVKRGKAWLSSPLNFWYGQDLASDKLLVEGK
jgi:hypothetical protein